MMNVSDDEDLKLALARSLEEAKARSSTTKDNPIVISSDDDEHPPLQNETRKKHSISANLYFTADPIPSSSTSSNVATANTFLSERAQLEAARLARLKRMRGPDPENTRTQSKSTAILDDPYTSEDEQDEQGPHPKKFKSSEPSASKRHLNITSCGTTFKNNHQYSVASRSPLPAFKKREKTPDEGELFWTGELRQTANMHVDGDKDTKSVFRLHDILGDKSELTLAILSSYVTQLSWIYSLLPSNLPVILVAQPDENGATSVHNVLPNWVRVTPQLRGGRGCMHIKFMLLFYRSGRVRIVIMTANLVDYDWRDVENSVWLQDIPPLPQSIPQPGNHDADDFPAHFERVLNALFVREGLKALIEDHPEIPLQSVADLRCHWDFSKVRAQLVPSLAGKHEGWPSVLRNGHLRLMRVVRIIGARADANGSTKTKGKSLQQIGEIQRPDERQLIIECQTSSIGSYTPAWIDEFLCSVRGTSPETWLDEVKTRRIKKLDGKLAQHGWVSWDNLKIIFPSLQTVKTSRLGEDGAGTMFCQRRQWIAPKFPRSLFHDSNSKRGRVLMHSKMILVTFETSVGAGPKSKIQRLSPSPDPDSSATEPSSDSDSEVQEIDPERDPSVIGWFYVGSHNFTPSAWGTLSGSSFAPVMNITNYELGIMLPLKDQKQANDVACWSRPPRKYNLEKDEAWIQK
ncbi:phospholipase D/nuclease [Ramaria rubella]|nr:phospholipase D/nuclease [Ramaria rubella]